MTSLSFVSSETSLCLQLRTVSIIITTTTTTMMMMMMMMMIITLDAMSEMNSLHIVEERCDVYHSQDVHVVPCNLTERAQIQKLIQHVMEFPFL
jgi:hypothetical protein